MKRIQIKQMGWLAVVMLLMFVAACSDENGIETPQLPQPEQPQTETPTGKKYTVPETGGTVQDATLQIEIPAETFTGEAAVYVDKLKSGSVRGDDEMSTFYKVTIPANTGNPMTVSITAPESDEDVIMVARTKAFSLSGKLSSEEYMPLDFVYSNGQYIAEIPAFHNSQDNKTMGTITFGLMRSPSAESSAEARMTTRSAEDGEITFKFDWGNRTKALENIELQETMLTYLNEALGKIKALGCKVQGNRKIPIVITPASELGQDEYGRYEMSFFGREWGYILVNDGFIGWQGNCNVQNLRNTLIHELFHYFQADYDPRVAWTKGGIVDTSGEFLMIYESGGVWIEKFMNNNEFSYTFVATNDRAPSVMRGLTTVTNNGYQNQGYGLSIFIEYMAQQYGNESIVKLMKVWNEGKASDALGLFKAWADELKSKLFSNLNFDQYLIEMCKGNVIPKFNFSSIIGPQYKSSYPDDIRVIEADGKAEFSGTVNPYGGRYRLFQILNHPHMEPDGTLKGKVLTFTEKEDGASTYIYLRNRETKGWDYYGLFNKRSPLSITDPNTMKAMLSTTDVRNYVYLLTTCNDQSKSGKSSVEVTLYDVEPTLSVSKGELQFEGSGGEQQIDVTTNMPTVKVSTTASWLDATYADGVITVKAEKNAQDEEREAYVIVRVQNGAGNLEKTVHVTQKQKSNPSRLDLDKQYIGLFVALDNIPLSNGSSFGRNLPGTDRYGTTSGDQLTVPVYCEATIEGQSMVVRSVNTWNHTTQWKTGNYIDEYGNSITWDIYLEIDLTFGEERIVSGNINWQQNQYQRRTDTGVTPPHTEIVQTPSVSTISFKLHDIPFSSTYYRMLWLDGLQGYNYATSFCADYRPYRGEKKPLSHYITDFSYDGNGGMTLSGNPYHYTLDSRETEWVIRVGIFPVDGGACIPYGYTPPATSRRK